MVLGEEEAKVGEKKLERGVYDLLNVVGSAEMTMVRDYLAVYGDEAVHFSSQGKEKSGLAEVMRLFVLTDKALYRIPQTTLQTGVFFDCRIPLETIAQITVSEEGSEALVEVFKFLPANAGSPNSLPNASPVHSAGKTALMMTASFGADFSIRKALLLAVCVARPSTPIMHKKRITSGSPGREGSPATGSPTQLEHSSMPWSPSPRDVAAAGTTPPARAARSREASWKRLSSSHRGLSAQKVFASPDNAPVPPGAATVATAEEDDITDTQLEEYKKQLRDMLSDHSAVGGLDPDDADHTIRPKEESFDRQLEREKIRATLQTREQKVNQNIEFHMKYSLHPPVRVQPGVEYDKSHQTGTELEDNYTDEELLGPSLYPLWMQWKKTGGLMGRYGDGGSSEKQSDLWNIFDSQDLIDSLNAREDVIFFQVGQKSMSRLISMRDMVSRERQMFLNKHNALRALVGEQQQQAGRGAATSEEREGDVFDTFNSPAAKSSNNKSFGSQQRSPPKGGVAASPRTPPTKTRPFRLSKTESGLRKIKLIDSKQMMSDIKSHFEGHVSKMHNIHKERLEREVRRAEGEKALELDGSP